MDSTPADPSQVQQAPPISPPSSSDPHFAASSTLSSLPSLPPPVGQATTGNDREGSSAPPLPATPATFGASPPLPPLPGQADRRISLSESLAQLQGEAAFATRPAAQVQAPPLVAEAVVLEQEVPAQADSPAEPFIEGLTAREIFVRLPEHDPVSALLDKYLPPQQRPHRDLSGNWEGQTLEMLIANRNYRATARYAYNAITQAPPERTAYILSHWLLRFHSLLRLRLIPQLAAELSTLLSLLPPFTCLALSPLAFPPGTPRFHPAVPFDLHVLAASLPSLQGNKLGAVEALSALLRSTKEEMWERKRAGKAEEEELWKRRAERLGRMLTDLLSEIKAPAAATAILASATPSPAIFRSLSRLHFATGNLAAFSRQAEGSSNEHEKRELVVLGLVAQGQWAEAEQELRKLVEEAPDDVEAVNNLAVVLLYLGKLNEAITLLTGLISSKPSLAYHDETLLFNLCTLFELRTEQALGQKVRLLRSAAEYGAQGIDAGAFKLAL
ncbi:hypothetical protein JCM8547_009259 [Rhodosporidiobolus lusitaniae]